ncbi:MAG: transcription initiation factor IIB [Nitrosopumilaceae archaeon]
MSKKSQKKICKHGLVITDFVTGEISCGHCGVVISEKNVVIGQETTGHANNEYQGMVRTGQQISLKMADMGLSTIIESQDKDSSGKSLSVDNKRSFYRLRMWDRNSRHAITNQSFVSAFTLLDGIRSKLALPDHVVEKTAYIFRKAHQKKLLPGRSTQVILCASVYLACRMTDTPRTLTDIAVAAGVKKKAVQRAYRFLTRELGAYTKAYNPSEFVSRISNEVRISEKSKSYAREILKLGNEKGITEGKNPMSMAAAAVYLAVKKNHEKIPQTRISIAAGISAVTIRNRVKELLVIERKEH